MDSHSPIRSRTGFMGITEGRMGMTYGVTRLLHLLSHGAGLLRPHNDRGMDFRLFYLIYMYSSHHHPQLLDTNFVSFYHSHNLALVDNCNTVSE